MAFCPSSMMEPPYGFGEYEEKNVSATASCSTWDEKDHSVSIRFRRVGDIVTVYLPELIYKEKVGGTVDPITIILDFNGDEDDYLGHDPDSHEFVRLGMRAYGFLCACTVVIDTAGTIYISPSDSSNGFPPNGPKDSSFGLFSCSFSYKIFVEKEDVREEEPPNKIAKVEIEEDDGEEEDIYPETEEEGEGEGEGEGNTE